MDAVTLAASTQQKAMEQIGETISGVDKSAQETAATAERSAEIAEELRQIAESISDIGAAIAKTVDGVKAGREKA